MEFRWEKDMQKFRSISQKSNKQTRKKTSRNGIFLWYSSSSKNFQQIGIKHFVNNINWLIDEIKVAKKNTKDSNKSTRIQTR